MLCRVNMIQTSLITEHGKLYAILLWYDSERVNPYMAIDREGTLNFLISSWEKQHNYERK